METGPILDDLNHAWGLRRVGLVGLTGGGDFVSAQR